MWTYWGPGPHKSTTVCESPGLIDLDLLDAPEELRAPALAALAACGVEDGHMAIALVDPGRIRDLNRRHRSLDEPTDVLSFPVDLGPPELGDVVICPEHTEDLAEATVHGVLHLCGMDHEADSGEMLELQARILAAL